MANTFKSDTKSDLTTAVITDAGATVVTAGATATLIVMSVLVSNKSGSTINIDVYLDKNSGDDSYLIKSAPVPSGSSLEVISGSRVVLNSSDKLQIRADAGTSGDATVSYLEQTP